MSGMLPSDSPLSSESRALTDDRGVRVLQLDDDEAEGVISSLSSDTARSILVRLHDSPHTASELADTVDTSVQNVRHHLSNLEEAEIVRVTDTKYSVKGREMNVYEPTENAFVVCVGDETPEESTLDALKQLFGAAIALVIGSAIVQWAFGTGVVDLGGPDTAPRVQDSIGAASEPTLALLPPGVAFFAGGLLVLLVIATIQLLKRR